jgi:hypothetical protein
MAEVGMSVDYLTNTKQIVLIEKFAELIVRDCMDVVDGYTKSRTFDTHYDAVEQIEALFGIKHFGVEELDVCEHDWYSAKNPVVLNGSVCVKCGALDPREPEELKNDSIYSR